MTTGTWISDSKCSGPGHAYAGSFVASPSRSGRQVAIVRAVMPESIGHERGSKLLLWRSKLIDITASPRS